MTRKQKCDTIMQANSEKGDFVYSTASIYT